MVEAAEIVADVGTEAGVETEEVAEAITPAAEETEEEAAISMKEEDLIEAMITIESQEGAIALLIQKKEPDFMFPTCKRILQIMN